MELFFSIFPNTDIKGGIAISYRDATQNFGAIGIFTTYPQLDTILQKVLSQEGLEKMEPIGENFDTDFHEAVALVPSQNEEQKGKVLDCVQTGYKLNDKVIRHAKVVVAQ